MLAQTYSRWELVVIDDQGLHSIQAVEPENNGALCIFEFFYLARPDTRLEGIEVHGARVRSGGSRRTGDQPVHLLFAMARGEGYPQPRGPRQRAGAAARDGQNRPG